MKPKSIKSLRKKLWTCIGRFAIKCKMCGKQVSGVIGRQKFCSVKCSQAYRYKINYVHKTRNLKSRIFNCSYCRKEIRVMPHRFLRRRVFCNRDHMVLFLKSNAFKKHCCICGKIFYCQPSQIKYRNRQTCSVVCQGNLRRIKAIENRKKNGFTKHQIDRCVRYSKQAEEWRKSVFKRDNYTCQLCGNRGGYIEAHHIKPFALFPELRFDLKNGMTLCRKCHDKTKISAKKLREKYEKKV